jgi:GNAT superfamily N-acetyltransferase
MTQGATTIMIYICDYDSPLFNDAVAIFTKLSAYYLGDNASSSQTVAANLKHNILGSDSATRLALAYYDGTVCALAAYAIMYPATKETGQLFLKELFVDQQYARKGVGDKMMSYLAKKAIEKNCSRFDWTANEKTGSTDIGKKAVLSFIKRRFTTSSGISLSRSGSKYISRDVVRISQVLLRAIFVYRGVRADQVLFWLHHVQQSHLLSSR